MKVERQASERTTVTNGHQGHRISYSQLSTPCDLRLKFRRLRLPNKDVSIALLYGRALHQGAEAFAKAAASDKPISVEEAVKASLAALGREVRGSRVPVRWDEPWDMNLDGSISAKTFGRLPTFEAAAYWLQLQVPVLCDLLSEFKITASEHSIRIPLTPKPDWKGPWSVECWLDTEAIHIPTGREVILDMKSSADEWGESDGRRYLPQALLYMGAYQHHYGRDPWGFLFLSLPRSRKAHEALVRIKESDEIPATEAEALLAACAQVHPIPFDAEKINTYIAGVIRPRISMIDAEAFAANPTGWWCSKRFCDYWDHCRFGEGTHL